MSCMKRENGLFNGFWTITESTGIHSGIPLNCLQTKAAKTWIQLTLLLTTDCCEIINIFGLLNMNYFYKSWNIHCCVAFPVEGLYHDFVPKTGLVTFDEGSSIYTIIAFQEKVTRIVLHMTVRPSKQRTRIIWSHFSPQSRSILKP